MADNRQLAMEQFAAFWSAEDSLEKLGLNEVRTHFETDEFKNDRNDFYEDVTTNFPELDDDAAKVARTLCELAMKMKKPAGDPVKAASGVLKDIWDESFEGRLVLFAEKVFGWKSPGEDEETENAPADPKADPSEASGGPETTPEQPAGKNEQVDLMAVMSAPADKLRQELPPSESNSMVEEDNERLPVRKDDPGYLMALAMAEDYAANAPEQLPALRAHFDSEIGWRMYGYDACKWTLEYLKERGRVTPAYLEARYGKPGTPRFPVRRTP